MELSRSVERRVEELQKDYATRSNTLARKITELYEAKGDLRRELIDMCQDLFQIIGGLIDDMQFELRAAPDLRDKYQNVLTRMKAERDQQRKDYDRATGDPSEQRGAARDKLLDVHGVHDDISNRTGNIERDLAETERTGVHVNKRLVEQREQIIDVNETLEETDESLARSGKTLKRIGRRVLTDKCTQGLIILVELGIIGLIVYLKFFKK